MKEQLNEIIKSENLQEITLDLLENVLDNEISNDVLKEIPILKSLVAVKNVYTSYSDRIFLKKSMNVIFELGEINWKQRIEFMNELKDEDSTGAEKLLITIDKLESIKKCKVFGRLCRLKAIGEITLEDFLRLTNLIQNSYLDDLALVNEFNKGVSMEVSEEDFYPLVAYGLIFQEPAEQSDIRMEQDNEYRDQIVGGEITISYRLSPIGELVLEYYNKLFPF